MQAIVKILVFRIHGNPDFEKEDIETIVGKLRRKPDKWWRKGDLRTKKAGVKHECDGFEFGIELKNVDYVDSNDIDSVFDRLVDAMHGVSLNMLCELQMSIIVYTNGQVNPGINISHDTINKLSRFDIDLDFDIYAVSGD